MEWFFELKLPSWDWQRLDYGRKWGWCQLHWVWTSRRGWFEWWTPCEREELT